MLGFTAIMGSPLMGPTFVPSSSVTLVAFSGVSHYGQSGISKLTVNLTTGDGVATVHDVRADTVTEFSYLVNGSPV